MSLSDGDTQLLQADGLSKEFDGFYAVRDVSFEICPGEIVGLIGPNGAGKTTVFNLLSGLLRPSAGRAWFSGRRIDGLRPYQVARLGMIRTFQLSRVLSRLSVADNLHLAAAGQGRDGLLDNLLTPGQVRRHEARARERATQLLAYFGLDKMADEYAGSLSGGQRKLLEMARALMPGARMLLLDEPMAGVNPALKETLLEYIADLRKQQGLTFFIIEHDLDMITALCDRVLVMAGGTVIAAGDPQEVKRHPDVVDSYLGVVS